MYRATTTLWLTADRTQVVPDGDPAARYLLVAAGGELDDATAAAYGLTAATKQIAAPPATKRARGPR